MVNYYSDCGSLPKCIKTAYPISRLARKDSDFYFANILFAVIGYSVIDWMSILPLFLFVSETFLIQFEFISHNTSSSNDC